MKSKINFFLISYFLFLFIGILSCDTCGPSPDKFKITGLEWTIDKSEYISVDPKVVVYDKYSIQIYFQTEEYYSMTNKIQGFNFINTAYACSPKPPTTDDKITNIEIFSDNDFNADNLSGANLAALFDVTVFEEFSSNSVKYDLNEYIATEPTVPRDLHLTLKKPPTSTSSHAFQVKYYQNGKDLNDFKFTTDSVEIRAE